MIWLAEIALCLAALLKGWPLLSAGGAALGRAIAWWCSGGLGWKLAHSQLEALRQQEAMADLQRKLAENAWRYSGFPAGERVRALQAGGVAYPVRRTCSCAWCSRSPGERAAWD